MHPTMPGFTSGSSPNRGVGQGRGERYLGCPVLEEWQKMKELMDECYHKVLLIKAGTKWFDPVGSFNAVF